jgi:hypothetical protein
MQQVWLALIGGLILGWLIEWIIDWQFWRRNVAELRQENLDLRRQLAEAQAQVDALQPSQPGAAAGRARLADPQPAQPAVPAAQAAAKTATQTTTKSPAESPAVPPAKPSAAPPHNEGQ